MKTTQRIVYCTLFFLSMILFQNRVSGKVWGANPIAVIQASATPEIYLPIILKNADLLNEFRSTPIIEPTGTVVNGTPTITATVGDTSTLPLTLTPFLTTTPSLTTTPVTPLPAGTATTLPTATSTPTPTDSSIATAKEQIIFEKLNEQRAANGVSTLLSENQLIVAARRHSLDMATAGHISHTGSDGSDGGERITDAGYIWRGWGEIIAWGYDTEYDQLIADWMKSSMHHAVILESSFKDMGVGQISQAGSPYQHYWTVNFGTRLANQTKADAYSYSCIVESGDENRGSILVIHSSTPCQALE